MANVIKRVRSGLNRIPAALGHLLSPTLAFFTPLPGHSPNAENTNTLYKITLAIALVIFIAVEGALIYALVKFRARKGAVARADPRQLAAGGRPGRPAPR